MPITRHGLDGGPRAPYGSFAGKTEAAVVLGPTTRIHEATWRTNHDAEWRTAQQTQWRPTHETA